MILEFESLETELLIYQRGVTGKAEGVSLA